MPDMTLTWARALLREAAAIYLAHLLPAVYSEAEIEAAVDAFINGAHDALHVHLNGPVDVAGLEAFWPAVPDLAGVDLFEELYGQATGVK